MYTHEIPNPEFDFDRAGSRRIKLELVIGEKLEFIYLYYFGDNRVQEIQVEEVLHAVQNKFYPEEGRVRN